MPERARKDLESKQSQEAFERVLILGKKDQLNMLQDWLLI
jgi:hypothetical protein